jgi:hypothetical protein
VSEEDMMIRYAGEDGQPAFGDPSHARSFGMQLGELFNKRRKQESDEMAELPAVIAAMAAAKAGQEDAPEASRLVGDSKPTIAPETGDEMAPAPAEETAPAPEKTAAKPAPKADAPVPAPEQPAAAPAKPEVDVDALFNQVLSEHGKSQRASRKPAKKPRRFLRPKQEEEIALSPAVQKAMEAQKAANPEGSGKKPAPQPEPAKKPDVDVDALFNQVLREHGKLK